MRTTTKEWQMVVDLYHARKKLKFRKQQIFVENLYEHLDEFAPFDSQQSPDSKRYLYDIHDYYIK